MDSALTFLLETWLALLCLASALACALAAAVKRRSGGVWDWRFYLPALLLSSCGSGAFDFMPDWLGPTLALTAFGIFILMLVLVLLTGFWHALLGHAVAGLLFFGLGAVTGPAITSGLNLAFLFLTSLRPLEPWWLLLLLFVPVLFWTSFRNLISLGPARRWLAIGLRCLLFVFLACALAEMQARKPNDSVTVLFVWDRSLSMPPDVQDGKDQREERILQFINDSVARRGGAHARDSAGVIVFGKQPKLELPPGSVPKLGFRKIYSPLDRSYTDIAAAIKLALASFPEGAAKRIVLISDGNENMGNAEEQARIAKQNGVQIDVVPIGGDRNQQNEVLIERIEAPTRTEKDSALPIRVVVRSYHPQTVVALLTLRKMRFTPGQEIRDDKADVKEVELAQGLNVYSFPQSGAKDDTVHSYVATVVPLGVKTEQGFHKGFPGDRVDNNEARACVIARGERAILLLEPKAGDHRLLADRLRAAKTGLKVVTMTPEQMQQLTKGDLESLATFLNMFDAVILANVPAEAISEEEQKVIRSVVHDQGTGLIMIGGNQSFGAGGWQNTEIEKALPVAMELKSMKIEGKSGLVLIMHASEMAEGNAWQRKIAKLAVEKLSPMDMIGLLYYDHGFRGGPPGHQWHINFQQIEGNRNKIMKLMDSMDPGDMPDIDPAFEKAYKELANPDFKLGTKHIILISDGDHWDASQRMLNKIRGAQITCTTVCITTHGKDAYKKMAAVAIAAGGRGRAYNIKDPKELPRIYIEESRLVSQSFIHEDKDKGIKPLVMSRLGPTEGMKDDPPPLYGFVRTTPKPSNLVQVLIETPKIGEYKFPLLAAWQYGLGRSVAFTSDARTLAKGSVFWDKAWAMSEEGMYTKFWGQTIDWVMRPVETGKHLMVTTENKDGKVRITVVARDLDKTPLTDLTFETGITTPTFNVKDERNTGLKFEQKNSGIYVADFPFNEVGTYFVTVKAKTKKDGIEVPLENISAGVTIPYSPEFAEMESKPALLEKLALMTGGKVYADAAVVLEEAARTSDVFRAVPQSHVNRQPIWPWLVFLTALCLLLDVAVRRIAIQPEAVWAKSAAFWQRLRGQATADDTTPVFIERLRSRKAQVEESMEKQKAARKFETDKTSAEAPTVVQLPGSDRPPAPPPGAPAPKPAEQEDFATRLLRAKKKALEDREKDKK